MQRIVTPSSPVPASPAKARPRPKPRAVSRTQITSDAEASTFGYDGSKRTGAVKAKKSKPIEDEDSDVPSRTGKPSGKGKGKGKADKGKGKAGDDEPVEEVEEGEDASARRKVPAPTTKGTGKRKAEREEAGSSRAGSLQPAHISTASTSGEAVPRKKKRTINIFGSAQDTTFEWGALSQVRCFLSRSLLDVFKRAGFCPG